MIGVKSIAVVGLAGVAVGVAVARDALALDRFADMSAESAFAVGLFASAAAALVGLGWRADLPSRAALAWRERRPMFVTEPHGVRELPAIVQRGLWVVAFAIVALATFTNTATARIASLPDELGKPSRARFCLPEDAPVEAPKPAPVIEQPVDEAGCVLVKRAVALGYKKDLGNCAPRVIKHESPAIQRERETCTKRQLDEPFVHFAWRRVGETASDASIVAKTGTWLDELGTRTDHARDTLADIKHAITGTPHASHHIFVTLPDPHPTTWRSYVTGHEPCASRFADLPLWPHADASRSDVIEQVLGQLLFATRFGTPASCSDYTIHWDAAPDTCERIARDPTGALADAGALASLRDVLDRRARQVALRALAAELERPALPEPPAARRIASVACLVVGASAAPTGSDIVIDGEPIGMRTLAMPDFAVTGAGPVAAYVAVAKLLGGTPYTGPTVTTHARVAAEPPGAPTADFALLALEPYVDADPFAGAPAAPLDDAELAEVYPLEQHLFAFIDAFRRAYLPQRGRL